MINSTSSFFGGIATGINSPALIESLVSAQRIPLLRLEEREQRLQSARSQFATLGTKVNALRSAAESLDSLAEIGAFSATSTDEDIVRVTASGAASVGSNTVRVTSLAAARTTQSTAETARTNTVGSGSIDITVNGTTTNVAIGAGDDLDDIATSINSADAGVIATVVQETSTSFRLVIQAEESGTANTFTLDATGFTASGSFTFVSGGDLVAASNAQLTFNGISITRSSNTITDIVDGLTFELRSAAPATDVTVGVTVDGAAIKAKIQNLLDAYNDVVGSLNAERNLSGDGKPTSSLYGDSTLRTIERQLRSTVGAATTNAGSEYTRLATIGIRSNANGQLSFDASSFDEAIAEDLEGVLNLFVNSADGVAQNFKDTADLISGPGSGLLSSRTRSIDSQLRSLNITMDSLEQRLSGLEKKLVQQFGLLEQTTVGLQGQIGSLNAIGSRLRF